MAKSGFPISYNIDAEDLRPWLKDNDYAGLKAHLQAVNPTVVLVMNGLWLAVRIKNEWLPDCIVIHRDYSGHEGSEWQARPPHEWVNRWEMQGHKNIVRYLTNEPGFHVGNASSFASREAETMKLARAAGFTVVALNTSVGTPERQSSLSKQALPLHNSFTAQVVQDGRLDELLKAAVEGNHFLGSHEYMTVCLPASLIGDGLLGDKSAMQPANWPTEPITAGYHDYWYLFRHVWLVARSREIGIADPKIILTEFGYDNIENRGNDDIIAALRLSYGLQIYNYDMRGVNTYPRIWNDYYPGVEHNQVIRQQFEWWLAVKPDWIIGACLFGINSDWDVPHGHDWSADVRRGFFPVLEEMSAAMAEPTQPELQPVYNYFSSNIDVLAQEGLRVRAGMSTDTNTNIIDTLPFGSVQLGTDLDNKKVVGNFEWLPVLYRGKAGFIALRQLWAGGTVRAVYAKLLEIELPDVPEVPDEPDVPEEPTAPPQLDKAAIIEIVRGVLKEDNARFVELPLPNFTFTVTDNNRVMLAQLMRNLATMFDVVAQGLEQTTPVETTSSISKAVNAAVNEAKGAKVVGVLTNNSATEPPEAAA